MATTTAGSDAPILAAEVKVNGVESINAAFETLKSKMTRAMQATAREAQRVAAATDKVGGRGRAAGESLDRAGSVGKSAFERVGHAVDNAANRVNFLIERSKRAVMEVNQLTTRIAHAGTTVASSVLGAVNGTASGIANIGKRVVGISALMAGAATGAYLALNKWTLGQGREIEDIDKMARSAGLSVELFSQAAAAARLMGVDVKTLGGAFKTLRDRSREAAIDPNGSAAQVFNALGIEVRETNGEIKRSDILFANLADSLNRIPDAGLKAYATEQLLGGGAEDLAGLLDLGSGGLQNLAGQAARFGTGLSGAGVAAIKAYLREWNGLWEALKGIGYELAGVLLPFFTNGISELTDFLNDSRGLIVDWADRIAVRVLGLRNDIIKLFVGNYGSIESPFVRFFIAPMTVAKNLLLDLLDVLDGGSVTRSRWLVGLMVVFGELGDLAKSFGNEIARIFSFSGDSSIESMLRGIAAAIKDVRLGFEQGKDGPEGFAADMGRALRTTLGIFVQFTTGLSTNSATIEAVFGQIGFWVNEALDALKALMSGDDIPEGNRFAWLNKTLPKLKEFFDSVTGWMDWLAEKLDLPNWQTLGIILLVASLTGALPLLAVGIGMVGSALALASGAARLFSALGGAKLLGLAGRLGAGALGLGAAAAPVAAGAVAGGAVAGGAGVAAAGTTAVAAGGTAATVAAGAAGAATIGTLGSAAVVAFFVGLLAYTVYKSVPAVERTVDSMVEKVGNSVRSGLTGALDWASEKLGIATRMKLPEGAPSIAELNFTDAAEKYHPKPPSDEDAAAAAREAASAPFQPAFDGLLDNLVEKIFAPARDLVAPGEEYAGAPGLVPSPGDGGIRALNPIVVNGDPIDGLWSEGTDPVRRLQRYLRENQIGNTGPAARFDGDQ
jgi:hypothetical protein